MMPLDAFALMVTVEMPRKCMRPVVRVLCTMTVTAGLATAARPTPVRVEGKLTATLSVLVPNPLYWA